MYKVGRGSQKTQDTEGCHILLGCSESTVYYLQLEKTAWSFLILEPNND